MGGKPAVPPQAVKKSAARAAKANKKEREKRMESQ
jgi:hypothetical protein